MSGCARLAGHKHNKSIFLVVLAGVEIARGTINLFYPAPGSPPRHGAPVPVLLLFFFSLRFFWLLRDALGVPMVSIVRSTPIAINQRFSIGWHTDKLLAKIPAEA
jgi:hypothetical protein